MSLESDFAIWLAKLNELARNLVGSVSPRADTSDVRQDVVVQLLRQGDDLLSVGPGYLAAAAKGHAAKTRLFHERECRSVVREVPLTDVESHEPSPDEVLQKREMLALLAEAVQALCAEDQWLIFLKFHCGLSFRKIAEEVRETERVVRTACKRVLVKLARLLGEDRDNHASGAR